MGAFRYWLDNMGDTTVASWVCAASHLMAGAYSWREAMRSTARPLERKLWAAFGLLFLAIGLNKQLDFQILLIKGLDALFGLNPYWGSRRLVAKLFLGALGVVVVWTSIAFGRAIHVRAWPLKAAAGASAALACLALARGTTGAVNDLLIADIHSSVAEVFRVQVKDLLEFSTATVMLVSVLSWRRLSREAAHAR